LKKRAERRRAQKAETTVLGVARTLISDLKRYEATLRVIAAHDQPHWRAVDGFVPETPARGEIQLVTQMLDPDEWDLVDRALARVTLFLLRTKTDAGKPMTPTEVQSTLGTAEICEAAATSLERLARLKLRPFAIAGPEPIGAGSSAPTEAGSSTPVA
jgi:hypothetical protein